MKNDNYNVSFYVVADLESAKHNNNIDGKTEINYYSSLDEAIDSFKNYPKDWMTVIGIQLNPLPFSAIDLVQRWGEEPILLSDFKNLPEYNGNPDVRKAVTELKGKLGIEWQTDHRIFNTGTAVLIPIETEKTAVRDRFFNGKHLNPSDPNHLITAIKEVYIPTKGWKSLEDIYPAVRGKTSYNPSVPYALKLTSLNISYTDKAGHHAKGDISPYNFLLIKERTELMENNRIAAERLANDMEIFLNPLDKDFSKQEIIENIMTNPAPLIHLVAEIGENGPSPLQKNVRELLGRLLNVPAADNEKIPLDLRLRATTVLDKLYQDTSQKSQTKEQASQDKEGR